MATPGASELWLRLVSWAVFYIGFAAVVRRWSDPTVWRFPLFFVAVTSLALVGWMGRPRSSRAMRTYIWCAVPLCALVLISSVVAWENLALYRWRYFSLRFLFIVPGIAFILLHERARLAFIVGMVTGASYLGLVGAARLVQGRDLLDIRLLGGYPEFLGVNRNLTATILVAVLPFVLIGPLPPTLRRLRIPITLLLVAFVVFSGSRGALLALALVMLALVLVQPSSSRAARALYAVLLTATVAVVAIQQIGGRAATSLDRLDQSVRGETTESDEIRRLVVRKAWNIALDHPLTGTGLGSFRGTYDPVLEEATTRRVSEEASYQADHNAYAGLMAEAGFPAFGAYALLLAGLLRWGLAHRHSTLVRAALCAFVSVLFALFFGLRYSDPIAYLTPALMLGAILPLESEPAAALKSSRGPQRAVDHA